MYIKIIIKKRFSYDVKKYFDVESIRQTPESVVIYGYSGESYALPKFKIVEMKVYDNEFIENILHRSRPPPMFHVKHL